MSIESTLLARQPIYDTNVKVVGYELLFRSGNVNAAEFVDGDAATSQVILNAFTEMPIQDILEGQPAYINFTRALLDSPPPLDKQQIVVEVLEDIPVDAGLIKAIKALKALGYTIALDDYAYNPNQHELIELADIIKVDVFGQDLDVVAEQIKQLRQFDAALLAEKVETKEIFKRCVELGFELFQGYFLSKPQIVKGKKVDSSQQSVIRLLSVLQQPNVEMEQIDKVISADPVLSFKLLRLVNSAMFGVSNSVDSTQRAISLLGLDHMRSWASLLVLSTQSDAPIALCKDTMIKARMTQLMGEASSCEFGADRLFSAALIASLDAFLDMPLAEVVNHLSLPQDMREVVVHSKLEAGLLLETATHFEHARLDDIDWERLQTMGLDSRTVEDIYMQSIVWSAEVIKEIT